MMPTDRLLAEGSPRSADDTESPRSADSPDDSGISCWFSCGLCGRRPRKPHWALPPPGLAGQKDLGIASALSYAAKVLFVATNVPYFVVVGMVFFGVPVPENPSLIPDTEALCASPIFHGCLICLLACVSTYWHGAQTQCQPACCRLLYCPDVDTGFPLMNTAPWMRRLVLTDVTCSVLTTLVGVACFGPARTLSWLSVPLVFFVLGAIAKRRGAFQAYAVYHGAWHCFSAAAIGAIVLGTPLPWFSDADPDWTTEMSNEVGRQLRQH
jgi:hypothetical protein